MGNFTLQAQGHRYLVSEVPNVQLKDQLQYVSDPERVLTEEDTRTLNLMLKESRDSLKVEIAVVILPHIDTERYETARTFANELFNTWGIGDKKTDRGLLILLLTEKGEREIVFETGYGLEQLLPDGLCKLIQTRKMTPFLKEEEFGAGLIAGVSEVEKVLRGTSELASSNNEGLGTEGTLFLVIWNLFGFIMLLIIGKSKKKKLASTKNPYAALVAAKKASGTDWQIGCLALMCFLPQFILYLLFMNANKRKKQNEIVCEKCGSIGTMRLKGRAEIVRKATRGHDGIKQYTFICKQCDHAHYEEVPYKYVSASTASSSSGSSSSGSSGGSWGGGRSGGGGASTRF